MNEQDLWEHLWSVACYDLALSDAQFWRLTPRKLDALLKRKKVAAEETELLFGQLTAAVINFSMCHPKEPIKIADCMPSRIGKPSGRGTTDHYRKLDKKMRQEIADSVRRTMQALM